MKRYYLLVSGISLKKSFNTEREREYYIQLLPPAIQERVIKYEKEDENGKD